MTEIKVNTGAVFLWFGLALLDHEFAGNVGVGVVSALYGALVIIGEMQE